MRVYEPWSVNASGSGSGPGAVPMSRCGGAGAGAAAVLSRRRRRPEAGPAITVMRFILVQNRRRWGRRERSARRRVRSHSRPTPNKAVPPSGRGSVRRRLPAHPARTSRTWPTCGGAPVRMSTRPGRWCLAMTENGVTGRTHLEPKESHAEEIHRSTQGRLSEDDDVTNHQGSAPRINSRFCCIGFLAQFTSAASMLRICRIWRRSHDGVIAASERKLFLRGPQARASRPESAA